MSNCEHYFKPYIPETTSADLKPGGNLKTESKMPMATYCVKCGKIVLQLADTNNE